MKRAIFLRILIRANQFMNILFNFYCKLAFVVVLNLRAWFNNDEFKQFNEFNALSRCMRRSIQLPENSICWYLRRTPKKNAGENINRISERNLKYNSSCLQTSSNSGSNLTSGVTDKNFQFQKCREIASTLSVLVSLINIYLHFFF